MRNYKIKFNSKIFLQLLYQAIITLNIEDTKHLSTFESDLFTC